MADYELSEFGEAAERPDTDWVEEETNLIDSSIDVGGAIGPAVEATDGNAAVLQQELVQTAVDDYYNALAGKGQTPALGRDYSKFDGCWWAAAGANTKLGGAAAAIESIELQDLGQTAKEASDAVHEIETRLTDIDIDKILETLDDPPLTLRKLRGLDKAMQTIRGELTNNLAKLTELDEHIALEKRKLQEAEGVDEITRRHIADPATMFHTLPNVQRGKVVGLQQYIDNRAGNLQVGLRRITYMVELPTEAPGALAPDTVIPTGQSYRLQHICQLKQTLENEREVRAALYKKYHRGINVVDGIDTALVVASMGMGIGGVKLLSTIIAAPVVLSLEIAALGCGILGVAGKFISRRLAVKTKKHDKIRVLADSKLNSIAGHVSTALVDGEISDHEFRLILDETEKYTKMKQEIQPGAKKVHGAVTIDEETKNSLIQRGRDEARANIIK
eukprot:g47113.t1